MTHLWSRRSSNTDWTSQTSYSSLSLVTLNGYMKSTVMKRTVRLFIFLMLKRHLLIYFFTLDAYSRYPLQPPRTQSTRLTLKSQTHVCVITLPKSVLRKVGVDPPSAQGPRPHQAGLVDQTVPLLQDPPEDRFKLRSRV